MIAQPISQSPSLLPHRSVTQSEKLSYLRPFNPPGCVLGVVSARFTEAISNNRFLPAFGHPFGRPGTHRLLKVYLRP